MRERVHPLQVVAALTVLGGLLRFATLDVQSFWLDEAVTVEVVAGSLGDVFDNVAESESTPYLYYVLAWAWGNVFGLGEVGLRSLSALVGTITIPVTYAAAARLVDRRTGVVAAAVVAVSPMAIHYSQEARAYGLLILAAAVTVVGFASLYRETGPAQPRHLVLWAGASCVSVGIHYFAVFLVAAEAATLLWMRADSRRRIMVALVPVAVTGLLLLPLALEQRSHGFADWIGEDSLLTRCVQVVKQFLVGVDGPAEKVSTTVAALLVLIGLWSLRRRGEERRREGALVAGTIGALAILVPLVVALGGPDYFNARNVIAAFVPLAIVAGAAWAARSRVGLALLATYAALSLVIVGVVVTDPRYQRDDWRGAARDLGPRDRARAIVVAPDVGRVPLKLYVPSATELPLAGVEVREVVYVGMGDRSPGGGATAPEPATLEPPAPGFRLVEERRAQTYTILRYRSAAPVRILPRITRVNRFGESSDEQGALVQPDPG